jgi:hypothetical protein
MQHVFLIDAELGVETYYTATKRLPLTTAAFFLLHNLSPIIT